MASIPSKPCKKCDQVGECFQHARMRENREAAAVADVVRLERIHAAQTQCGVYSIRNIVTGREYIGQTVTNFYSRWAQHRTQLRHGSHPNRGLQADWKEYGELKFDFAILEVTSTPSELERHHIHIRKVSEVPLYNPREC